MNVKPAPVDSILEAVLTVSPNRQYRGIFLPTTPATQGPEMIPIHISVKVTNKHRFPERKKIVALGHGRGIIVELYVICHRSSYILL